MCVQVDGRFVITVFQIEGVQLFGYVLGGRCVLARKRMDCSKRGGRRLFILSACRSPRDNDRADTSRAPSRTGEAQSRTTNSSRG